MEENRGSFTGKLGFVLAAAGSAVGLGNIWRFPYLAAKYGGGTFLLIYIILVLTLGFALLMAEISIGRKTGLSCITAFNKLKKNYSFIGVLASIVPVIITPYYCVIGGWVTKYLFESVKLNMSVAAQDDYFGGFISQVGSPILFFCIFLGLTALVVLLGVEDGIEKVSKIMMPLLVVLTIVIAVYGMFLPGAKEGLVYYLKPDFSNFSIYTVLNAMGQMFYSMSLAMGIMITYGSYMKKDIRIESSVRQIQIFDTGIAFLAGLMIIPAVVAFSGKNSLSAGPGLMFMTLPKVFDSMPGGSIIAIVFFLLVLLAALTSSISLMETVVSIIKDKFKIGRTVSCIITIAICLLLGIPSSLGNGVWANVTIFGMDFLTFFDFLSNNVLMPVVAFLISIFVGYIIKPKAIIEEAEVGGAKFSWKHMFTIIIKYVAPICILAILVFSILTGLGIIKV